jgi:hypothetical protein
VAGTKLRSGQLRKINEKDNYICAVPVNLGSDLSAGLLWNITSRRATRDPLS